MTYDELTIEMPASAAVAGTAGEPERPVVTDWRWEKHAARERDRQEPQDGEPECNYCNSMRYVVDLKGELKPCPLCRVVDKWRGEKLAKYSSASGKARTQTFKNFKTTTPALRTLRDLVRDFAQAPRHWLFVHGRAGNGKTHLCAAAYNALAAAGREAYFVSMPDLLASLKALFDESNRKEEHDTYQRRLQMYQRAEVLIVDDLGAERQTDWTDGVLFELLDYRYRNQLATLLSSNLDPHDTARFDARLISRWHDSAFSTVIKNTAPDYRQVKQP